MKTSLSTLTVSNHTHPQNYSFTIAVPEENIPQPGIQAGISAIAQEMECRNSLGYGVGKLLKSVFDKGTSLVQGTYSMLPSFSLLPGAEAASSRASSLILPEEKALALLKSKITVTGTKGKKVKKEITDRFVKIFTAARNEGKLTKENFDIFLQHNRLSRFVLHAEADNPIFGSAAAIYRADQNTVHINASPGNLLHWEQMHSKLIHEVGHAADDTRGAKAFQENPAIITRNAYHHMDDADAETSRKVVSACITAIKKAGESANEHYIRQFSKPFWGRGGWLRRAA